MNLVSPRRHKGGTAVALGLVLAGFTVAGPAASHLVSATEMAVPTAVPRAAGDPASDEAGFIASINGVRSAHGIPALRTNAALHSIATNWSGQMSADKTLYHNPQLVNQLPNNWNTAGENVGVGPDEPSIADAFIKSPEHYVNIVRTTYTDVGVGVVYGQDGRLWVTEDFASFTGSSAPPPSTPPPVSPATPATTPPPPATTRPTTPPPASPGPPASTTPAVRPAGSTTTTPTDVARVVSGLKGLDANS